MSSWALYTRSTLSIGRGFPFRYATPNLSVLLPLLQPSLEFSLIALSFSLNFLFLFLLVVSFSLHGFCRCKSFSHGRSSENTPRAPKKSKSWPRITAAAAAASLEDDKRVKKGRVAPEGCFSVYVGPEKQRFVIKTEYANHPLFKILLEEAELEYGYNSEGPLALPCNVEIFHKVLLEMDSSDKIHQGCTFPRSHSSYRLLSPSPMIAMNHF